MSNPKISNTEQLRDDVLSIRQELRDGKVSNSVARTLLQGAKIALETLKAEMEASRLGADFKAVELHEEVRAEQKPRLARAA